MKRILYIDCFSGISGDMMLGAFLGLGIDFSYLKKELEKLGITGYTPGYRELLVGGISAFKFDVMVEDKKTSRNFADIKKIIRQSALDQEVKDISMKIFKTLAAAEAKVHGRTMDTVHFHEVGAIDSIIDIAGIAISLNKLGIEEIFSREVPLGRGFVDTAHGRLPVPAPATIEILKDVPVYQGDFDFEVTTPTGAAVIRALAEGFGGLPPVILEGVGYGAGSRFLSTGDACNNGKEKCNKKGHDDYHNHGRKNGNSPGSCGCHPAGPNVLRLLVGKTGFSYSEDPDGGSGSMKDTILLSANIDDSTPEILGYVLEKIRGNEVLDAWIENIYMKKGRPAFKLCVICDRQYEDTICRIIFKETTTLGVRRDEVSRYCLERKTRKITLPYGEVEVKVGIYMGKEVNFSPEYETCRSLAEKTGKPLKEIYRDAILFFSRR